MSITNVVFELGPDVTIVGPNGTILLSPISGASLNVVPQPAGTTASGSIAIDSSASLNFTLNIPAGTPGSKGDDGNDGVGVSTITATQSDIVAGSPTTITFDFGMSDHSTKQITATVPAGAKGDAGDNGISAYQVAVKNGYTGTETAWLASLVGATGESAYQAAVDGGFVGTQADWIASLKGEKGDPGPIGPIADTTDWTTQIPINARSADKRYVHNNAAVSGGVIALDLSGTGNGDLSYQKADGSWAVCQPFGDYATNTDLTNGLARKEDALGFTPVAQLVDKNTIGVSQLGWNTNLSCVVGRDTGGTLRYFISSNPTTDTYDSISQIARVTSSGQLIAEGTNGNLTYYVPQKYVDDAVSNVQSNLTNAVAAQSNTNGQITALGSRVLQLSDTTTQTVTGPVTFSGNLAKDQPVGIFNQYQITAGGSDRWNFGSDGYAESGTSTGSNFVIARFDNTGKFIDVPFAITRETGVVAVFTRMTVPDITVFTGTDAVNARSADKRYVHNNAAVSGGVIALDLSGTGNGDLSYQKADGSWAVCQPFGDYATNTDLTNGLARKEDALGFTPVAQLVDKNTIGVSQLGWNTNLSCVVGRDTGGTLRYFISSNPTTDTYDSISQIARVTSSGQLIAEGTNGNLTYYVPQKYVDDAVSNVQSNLTNAVAAQSNTNGQITALANSKVGQWSDANTSPITSLGFSTANQSLVARDGTGTLRNPIMSMASTGYIAVTNLNVVQSNNYLIARGWDGDLRYYYDSKAIDAINTALTTKTTNSAEAAVLVLGSTSVTVPSGFTRIEIRGVGAGGGGGGCKGVSTADTISGAGGGSGPYVEAVYPVSSGDVIAFTMGAGGAGGTGDAGVGSDGGTTTVARNGNPLFILYGGSGGGKPANGSTSGGAGGGFDVLVPGNVFINFGTDGSDGQSTHLVFAGNGASSAYGGGGRAGGSGGRPAKGYGGGGGGAYDSNMTGTSYAGGSGRDAALFYRFLI